MREKSKFNKGDRVVSTLYGETHVVRIWDKVYNQGEWKYCIEAYSGWQSEETLKAAPPNAELYDEDNLVDVRRAALAHLKQMFPKREYEMSDIQKSIDNPPRRMNW